MGRAFDRDALLTKIGSEIRELRESADLPQQAVSDVFGWGRDAMSKIETGKNNIDLIAYLRIMDYLRDVAGDHPAVALADHVLRSPRRRAAAR